MDGYHLATGLIAAGEPEINAGGCRAKKGRKEKKTLVEANCYF